MLRGLPIILGDNPTNFFKAGFVSKHLLSFNFYHATLDSILNKVFVFLPNKNVMIVLVYFFIKESDDESFRDLDIGILLVEREDAVATSSHHLSPASLKIIIEGEVVMRDIEDLPKAMCILFGLTYALHLNYPKTMKLTFLFIQQVLLSLGHSDLKPKLQTLKNQLTM